jgi:excisionase family DNA binding protein
MTRHRARQTRGQSQTLTPISTERRLSVSLVLPKLLTVPEVASVLNLSCRQVRRMIADGRLPVLRIGRVVRISPEVLTALIEDA